jgi:hypothetical protein
VPEELDGNAPDYEFLRRRLQTKKIKDLARKNPAKHGKSAIRAQQPTVARPGKFLPLLSLTQDNAGDKIGVGGYTL